jgi:hypothetical protein
LGLGLFGLYAGGAVRRLAGFWNSMFPSDAVQSILPPSAPATYCSTLVPQMPGLSSVRFPR